MQGPPICSFFVPVVAAGATRISACPVAVRIKADRAVGRPRQDRHIAGAGGSWSGRSHGGGGARGGGPSSTCCQLRRKPLSTAVSHLRSEERRVGKECRSRWS